MLTDDPGASEQRALKIVLHKAVRFLRRQRNFIMTAVVTVVASTALFNYLVPMTYTAAASVVLERRYNSFLRRQSERPIPAIEMASDLIDITKSRPVIDAVVRHIRQLDSQPQHSILYKYLYQWEILTEPSPRRRLARGLRIEAKESYITIRVTDEDPAFAMSAVNAVVNELRRRYVDLFDLKSVLDRHQDLLLTAQSEIAAQHRLLIERSGVLPSISAALADDKQPEDESIPSVPADRTTGAGAKALIEDELRRALLAKAQPRAADGQEASVPAEVSQTYRLNDYDAKLYQLRHLRELGDTLDSEKRMRQSRYATGHSDMLLIQQNIDAVNTTVASIEGDLNGIARAGAASKETLALIKALGPGLDSIGRRIDLTRLYTRSDMRAIGVRIAEYAEMPGYPDETRFFKLMVGMLAGGILALGSALIRDRRHDYEPTSI